MEENSKKEIMSDVTRIEAEAKGFRLIDLFGNTVFIEGSIQIVDLVDEHYVIIEKN